MNEFMIIAKWYLAFLGLGIIGMAITYKIFGNWKDKGYGLAKFIGLLAVAMPIWFLSTWHIIPFTTTTALGFYLILLAGSAYYLFRKGVRINRFMVIEELLFLIVFSIWTMVRSTSSMIEGTEKMMNLAIMNSIMRTEYFPPQDVWMSNLSINYYYIGHYLFTYIGKGFEIAMAYGYNLALVTIIAQVFIGTISLLGEITGLFHKHWKLGFFLGIIIASWLCFGSNLHYMWTWIDKVIVQGKEFTYWFPDGTRIIPNAIDEFPAYSVTLGDVHGHYMGFPYITMFMGFLYTAFKTKLTARKRIFMNLAFSPALFALYGINTWDFITVNFMFLVLHLYQAARLNGSLINKIAAFSLAQGALLLPGIPFMLPYFMAFRPAVSGINVVPLDTNRPIVPYLQMWGAFLMINLLGIATLWLLSGVRKIKPIRLIKDLAARNHNAIFALFLTICAICLILGVEVFYVRDIFEKDNGAFFRTNTVFKFYFAAWNIWAVASGYVVYAIFKGIFSTPWRRAFPYLVTVISILVIVYVGCVSYIFKAVTDFYPFMKFADGKAFTIAGLMNGKQPTLYKTINGNDYIKGVSVDDAAIIDWFNKNVTGQPVVLEQVGDAYTYSSRISTNTGIPTVMGWPTHEWQWRNTVQEIYIRKDDVQTMYTTKNDAIFTGLIDKYVVNYIVISELENKTYEDKGGVNRELINKYFDKVFTTGQAEVYRYKGLSSTATGNSAR